MAPSILSLKRVVVGNVKCASSSPRFFCSRSPVEELRSYVHDLGHSVSPGLVALATFFSGSDDRTTQPFSRHGTGVLLGPKLIVTSAHVVGDVSTSYKDRLKKKGSITHTAYIGTTAALNIHGETLTTRPLALNFGNDVAVLELMDPEGTLFSHCALVGSPPEKENILLAIAHEREFEFTVILGNVRVVKEKTIRAKAPWPRDDELGWIEHDWFFYGGGGAPPGSTLCTSRKKVSGAIAKIPGSPWFNLNGEVVGIASWEVRDEAAKFAVGFAASSLGIRSVLDYAKAKRPEDPIVMDSWINAHKISGN